MGYPYMEGIPHSITDTANTDFYAPWALANSRVFANAIDAQYRIELHLKIIENLKSPNPLRSVNYSNIMGCVYPKDFDFDSARNALVDNNEKEI